MVLYAAEKGDYSPSTAVRLLLAKAMLQQYRITLPIIQKDSYGKPSFSDYPNIHFSLSHSGILVFCAVSSEPCGADIQEPRHLTERLISRTFSLEEQSLDLLPVWCLKESFIKLQGRMDRPLKEMTFIPSSDGFRGPDKCFGQIYRVPFYEEYAAAAVSRSLGELPADIKLITI